MTPTDTQRRTAPTGTPPSGDGPRRPQRSWVRKFGDACRGIKVAMRGDVSFFVHLFVTALVIMVGLLLGLSLAEWCVVVLTISLVITTEMCNTAIEHLARTITLEDHPQIRNALDIAAGAVLLAAVGAVIVGVLVLGVPLWELVF